jgi:hypothetical protein
MGLWLSPFLVKELKLMLNLHFHGALITLLKGSQIPIKLNLLVGIDGAVSNVVDVSEALVRSVELYRHPTITAVEV